MKTRQKRKNANHEKETRTSAELISRSLSHLNRSLRQFSEGLQTRVQTLQDRLVVEPLESAAWVISQRVRKVQNRVFDYIDEKISMIEDARHKKLDHQTALERFDDEGGAMLATSSTEDHGDSAGTSDAPAHKASSKAPKFAFEPRYQQ